MTSMIFSAVRGVKSFLKPKPSASSSPSHDETNSDDDEDTKVLSVSWNQDWTAFIVGTNRGFNVYNCDPFTESISHYENESGFKIAEMLFLSNLFALVGDGYRNSMYPPHKVFIWDDFRSCYSRELSFKSRVIAVKMSRERIVVVLERTIFVYSLVDLRVHCVIETTINPKGICCVSQIEMEAVLACPGLRPGLVQVHDLRRNRIKLIKAHDSDLACMTLTLDGRLLATSSTKGTLIRIFNALDGTRLQELRRGIERAEIYSIAISINLKWVAVSSDKGTLHVFRLRPDILSIPKRVIHILSPPRNITQASSSFSFMRGVLPKYVCDEERSFAQLSLPVSTKFIVGFGVENTILIAGIDGRFDEEEGHMVELEHKRFLP